MGRFKIMCFLLSTTLAYGLSALTILFGAPPVLTPFVEGNTPVSNPAISTVSTFKRTQGKVKMHSLINKCEVALSDSLDGGYKTAYWVGSLPEELKDKVNIDGLLFIDSTAFSKAVPATIRDIYINANGITSIIRFVNSPAYESIAQKGIRLIIYNDKASDRDEQLVIGLGGLNTDNADFIMITHKKDSRSIVPVGNHDAWFKPNRLSIFQKASPESIVTNLKSNSSARLAASDGLWKVKKYKINSTPYNWAPSNLNKSKKSGIYYVYGRKIHEKTGIHESERLLKSHTAGRGNLITELPASSGPITHRQVTTQCVTKTVSSSWGFKVSATFGYTAKLELFGQGASFSVKLNAWYDQVKTRGYTSSTCVAEGQTYYSNPCAYACCNSEASVDFLQDTYQVRSAVVGDVWYEYTHWVKKYASGAKSKITKLKKPVILRYNYTRSTPYYSTRNEQTEVYASLEIRNVEKGCNPTGCYEYKSNICAQTVK